MHHCHNVNGGLHTAAAIIQELNYYSLLTEKFKVNQKIKIKAAHAIPVNVSIHIW